MRGGCGEGGLAKAKPCRAARCVWEMAECWVGLERERQGQRAALSAVVNEKWGAGQAPHHRSTCQGHCSLLRVVEQPGGVPPAGIVVFGASDHPPQHTPSKKLKKKKK